jgi:hypothetical protein
MGKLDKIDRDIANKLNLCFEAVVIKSILGISPCVSSFLPIKADTFSVPPEVARLYSIRDPMEPGR